MKKPVSNAPKPLSFKARRQIEVDLGVYLSDSVQHGKRGQRFSVFDEDEAYVGTVQCDVLFTSDALISDIRLLFKEGAVAVVRGKRRPGEEPRSALSQAAEVRVHEDNR